MNQIPTLQSKPVTEYPSPEDLYPYAVKIVCSDPSDNSESLGSGVLFCDNRVFKVMTARHCLYKNDKITLFPIENIKFYFAEDETRTFTATRIIETNEAKDFALLEVNFVPMPFQEALYEESPFFIGKPSAGQTKTYGFSKSYPKGTSIKVEHVSPETYRSMEGILASGRDMEMIRGFSGGGVFTKVGPRIICEGYIKSKYELEERLEEIAVGTIPNLGEKIWAEKFNIELGQDPYISSGNNSAKIDYLAAWRDLLNKIKTGNDCSSELKQVIEKRKEYCLSKSDSYQEQTIWTLFRKETDWTKIEQDAFLIALADLGQWPSLYGELPEKAGNIEKNPNCLPLLHRAASLLADDRIEPQALNVKIDSGIYESILRALFRFDFEYALSTCVSWVPESGDYFGKKLMLLHLLGIEDEELSIKLDDYLKGKHSGLEKAFVDTVIANQCDFHIPPKHSYERFNKSGLDSPGEVLKSILNNIDKREEKISVYGVHTTELLHNPDNTSLPAALRALNYLIESGLPPSDGFVWNISTYNWLKVFKRLFRSFPYPVIFYSLLYRDEKLLRRIGQEMAFTDDESFRAQLPDVITGLLKSLITESTPNRMISSIFSLTGELFCSVNSSVWVNDFLAVLLRILNHTNVKNLSYRDDFCKFVSRGMQGLRHVNERVKALTIIAESFSENPILFSYILVNSLNFNEELSADEEFNNLINRIIADNSFESISLLVAQLNYLKLLTEDRRKIIYDKIKNEGLSFARRKKDILHNLTFIIPPDKSEELKNFILELDIWDCGIRESSYRSVDDFWIESISLNIVWTEQEQQLILQNLADNLSKIEKVPSEGRLHVFLGSSIPGVLGRMLRYVETLDDIGLDISNIRERIYGEICRWTQSSSILERLITGDHNQTVEALNDIIHQVKLGGVGIMKKEIQFIINQALTKNQLALSNIIDVISHLTTNYTQEFLTEFGNDLLLLLKSFCGYDYEALHLHVPFINSRFIKIAKALKPSYPDHSAVKYWLSDDVQNRFFGE